MLIRWSIGLAVLWPCIAGGAETLGICYREDAAPFSYISDTGEPTGYTIDLCKRVASSLEVRPKMIKVTSQNRFDELVKGSCDLLCEASTITMERREIVEFSLITFVTGSAILYPEELLAARKTGTNVRVGYLRGTTIEDQRRAGTLIGGDKAKFEFVAYSSHEEAQTALNSGELQSYIADREILNLILKSNPTLARTHRVTKKSITYEPYAIAVRLGDDKLRLSVDRVLASLFRKPEAMKEILLNHIPNRSDDPLLEDLFKIQSIPE